MALFMTQAVSAGIYFWNVTGVPANDFTAVNMSNTSSIYLGPNQLPTYQINVTTNVTTGDSVASVNITGGICYGTGAFSNLTSISGVNRTLWSITCTFNHSAFASEKGWNVTITAYNTTGSGASASNTTNLTGYIIVDRTSPTFTNGTPNAFLKPDLFFSPLQNLSINVTITEAIAGVLNATVTFNLTNGTGLCEDKTMNLTSNSTWFNQEVSNYCNLSLNVTHYNITYPTPAYATIYSTDRSNNSNSTTITGILVHNLGAVQGPPANATVPGTNISANACTREGTGTTNMSNIANFNAAFMSFVMSINGSSLCNPAGINMPWGDAFQTVAMFNFTSVNISTQEKAQTVMSAMGSLIQVQMSPPRSHGTNRIFVNSTAASMLNSSAKITLYGMPFRATPNVTYDGGGTNNVNLTWVQGDFNSTIGMWMGDLTISLGNFTGYNFSDSVAPWVRIENHTNGTNYSATFLNFTVNGTGTDIANITATITNSTGSTMGTYVYAYNHTTHSLNCTNVTGGLDLMNCTIGGLGLPAAIGNYTLTVTAYDYGGTAGNSGSGNSWFMNNTPPSAVYGYATNHTHHSTIVYVNVTDANADLATRAIAVYPGNFSCSYLDNYTSTTLTILHYNCTNNTAYNASKNFTVNVTAVDTYGNTFILNITDLFLPNNAPTLSSVSITPVLSPNVTGLNLTCTVNASDSDDDAINYTYVWYRNSTAIYAPAVTFAANNVLNQTYFNLSDVIRCSVVGNDSGNASFSLTNSSARTILRSAYTNATGVTSDDCNGTVAQINMTFADTSGNMLLNISIPAQTNITPVPGFLPGTIYIAPFTATTGDLSDSHAFGLNYVLGPPGTNFTTNATGVTTNITLVFNYSSLSTAQRSTFATALAAGYLKAKKCNESGEACTSITPTTYDTSAYTVTVNVSSFSTIGLYDTSPTPASTSSSSSSSSSTGGGSVSRPGYVPPTTTPSTPSAPTTPSTPSAPGTPSVPTTPTLPVPTPSTPSAPSTPSEAAPSGLIALLPTVGLVVVIVALGAGAFVLLRPKGRKGL